MKTIFLITKPKSAKTIIATEQAAAAVEAVATMIMIGPYLQEDILSNTDKRLMIRDLEDENLKIKTCQGFFKIERMELI